MSTLTLREKVAQLGSCWIFELLRPDNTLDPERLSSLLEHGVGQITRVSGASTLGPVEAAAVANEIQRFLADETRPGLPAIVHEECLDGYMAADATSFPQSIGAAATFDPALIEAAARIAARQMRAAGVHQGLSPVLDIGRDPRWGRIEETFGEDPYLVAMMACAHIRGLQGDSLAAGVIATAKHFVAHGMPEGGMNAAPPHLGERELRDVHLRPFEAAVREADVRSVMHAYHEIDAVPCAANRRLLREILRDEIGFAGTIVSDYSGIEELVLSHAIADDLDSAALMGLAAGIDIELPSTVAYSDRLERLVAAGALDESAIDEAVTRSLRQKIELGLLDDPFVVPGDPERSHDEADAALATDIAARSAVLVQSGGALPLGPTQRVAVVGPNAASGRNLLGDYGYEAHIDSLAEFAAMPGNPLRAFVPEDLVADTAHIETILDALRRLAPEADIVHAPGGGLTQASDAEIDEAVALCESADVAVIVVGERSGLTDDCTCGEARDRMSLDLLGRQQELIERVAATGTPTVVVVVGGRPPALETVAPLVDSILFAWLPGAHGADGIARVLLGHESPGGKLPVNVARHAGQVPSFYRHHPSGGQSRWKGRYADGDNRPMWVFGHGLSYTSFEFGELRIEDQVVDPLGTIRLSCQVSNAGRRSGDEVVQLYITDDRASVVRPVRQLEGFVRVTLAPAESARVHFEIPIAQLAFHDAAMRRVVEPGSMTIAIGSSSADLPLTTSIEIGGEVTEFERPPICGTAVRVERSGAANVEKDSQAP